MNYKDAFGCMERISTFKFTSRQLDAWDTIKSRISELEKMLIDCYDMLPDGNYPHTIVAIKNEIKEIESNAPALIKNCVAAL